MALANGAIFAGYTVVRRLGSSATGQVYLVQQPGSPGWQALKVLPLAMSADDEFCRRFHRETAIAANLYHPNILEVHERGEFDGQLWIAMDYVDGIDAVQHMANRFPTVLPVGEVLSIVTAVAEALDYAHQRGLLHRDVKPAHILLTNPGVGEPRILLTDFGIGRQLGGPDGGVAYLAPEQLMGAPGDGRADQYALASTAMHLFTGAPPVDSADAAPPPLSVLRPDLARLDGALSKALANQPADRFGSCREFAAALAERAGIAIGDRSPDALATIEDAAPVYVVDYPAYDWPETAHAKEQGAPDPPPPTATPKRRATILQSAAAALARRLDEFSTETKESAARRRLNTRRIVVGLAAALLLVGLFAVGITIGRETSTTSTQASSPATSAAAVPSAPTTTAPGTPPVPLDGTYRIEVERSKQTFDYTPTPQPPDVNTWWAIRSSCTPTRCLAAARMLDDNDHTLPKPGVRPLVMEFGDGQWRTRPETVQFACIGRNGAASTQTTTQVLSLRPQPEGDLVGEMVVTVETNECNQQFAVIRIPAVASRSGDVPPSVAMPDPAQVPAPSPANPSQSSTANPTPPSTTASGPGR
ncbi:Serine/threonine-protein kinase PknI [Mycobacterium simulans]|uniref:non-specific serine/threonine protein kinase n=1 Tax=Mycobacterium simulans TaxID=627089 RepID=A0A7Z7N953_9MYCO|nr:serine/threonine-protein kinase [Mycobacterium simulans]SOJ54365.1 Serine/threonine-protein kinase PknI [Mycobacterium simulans]